MGRRLMAGVVLMAAGGAFVLAGNVSAEPAAFTDHLACAADQLIVGADFTGSGIPTGETTVSNQTVALPGNPGGGITLSGVSPTETAFWRLFDQTSGNPLLAGTSVELSIGTFGESYTATIDLTAAFAPQFVITDIDNAEFITVTGFNGATPVAPSFDDASLVTETLNGTTLELESISPSLTDDLVDTTTTTIWFTSPVTRVQFTLSNPNDEASGASIEITRFVRCADPVNTSTTGTTGTTIAGNVAELPATGSGSGTAHLALVAAILALVGTAGVVRARRTP